MMIFRLFTSLILMFGLLQADEGMWLLTQLPQLNLQEKGLELTPEQVYSPDQISISDAIVWLGGCSASFVSENGLLVTNHHCAYGALQRASSKQGVDYIRDGFLAADRTQELPALGSNAYVLEEITDVTSEILAAAEGVSDLLQRDRLIRKAIAAMEADREGGRDDVYARVAEMFSGQQYQLFIYKKYQDVRIVYAPPASIGKYGGDIDNWMWPRHTGDFTFMRVYMAPDGSGATYSEENIPVKPKNYLRIARTPLQENDLTFIMGFPGRTTRWRTSHSVRYSLEQNYIPRIKEFGEIIDLMDELTKDDPQGKIKVAGFRSGLANTMKNYQGKYDGMMKTGFIGQKQKYEQQLAEFLKSNPELEKKYGTVVADIGKEYELLTAGQERNSVLNSFGRLSGLYTSLAGQIYDYARERAKPEEERDPGFSEKRIKQSIRRIRFRYLSFFEPFDKALLARSLKKAARLPEAKRIKGLDDILSKDIQNFIDDAYAATRLKDTKYVMSLFEKSAEELEAIDDPFLKLAVSLYPEKEAHKKEMEASAARMKELRRKYIEALQAWKGDQLYPDANGTIRFTYGTVKGYSPADAIWYKPFTTLAGVVEKATGEEPFDMPAKLGQLHQARDFGRWMAPNLDDVPVAFTHDCDITGGNSGSAVMNARGELIGLAFDGNYEAMVGDWQFDDEIQRTISVDIRYVLFVTEKFAGADYILKELGF